MKINKDIQAVLNQIAEEIPYHYGRGKVANYIPKLASVDPNQFGMTVIDSDGQMFSVGKHKTVFSIQSVSKVFLLTMVLNTLDQEVWGRLDREPSGKAFDSYLVTLLSILVQS